MATGTNQRKSCTTSGFCCGSGIDYDGKFKFSCGMKSSCTGRQDVQKRSVYEKVKYIKEGKVIERAEEKRTESVTSGACRL